MELSQVAAQLYTCRDALTTPAEIVTTLRRLRAVGYTAVQVSGMAPIAEEDLIKILDDEGLICCATQEPGGTILNEPQKVVDRLNKLRCSYTAFPFPSDVDLANRSEVETLIEKLDSAGKILADTGLTLCYHNHSHEFRKLGNKTILDLIYEGTNRRNLQAELDTFWIHYGGGENVEWCEKLSGRLPLLHLKDYAVNSENQHQFCEIGSGNLNFKKIIPAAEKAGCEWFIVEQDECPGDPVDSLAQSYAYIKAHLAS